MYSFKELSQIIPFYKQEGIEETSVLYLLLGLFSCITCFILSLVLKYLERQSYYETRPPEDILEIIREIDREAREKKEQEENEKKEDSLEERVKKSFMKTQLYGQDRSSFRIVSTIFSYSIDILTTISGFLPFMYDISKKCMGVFGWNENEIAVSITCMILQSVFDTITNLPWDYYDDFVIEQKHGFNKQTNSIFFKDVIKEFFVEILTSSPLYAVLIFILNKAGPNATLYCWIVFVLFSIVLNMIYPIVIMPLFNKMSPMEDTPLRKRIYEIAEKVGFRVGRIQIIDSSQRTGHSNAAAYGLFGVNGILIYDNLFSQLTDDEIVAVICHELGHWKHRHTYRMLFTNALYMFLMFRSFSFFVFNPHLYSSYGFHDTPVIIGLTIFMSSIWKLISLVSNVIMHSFSRRYEYQADAYAVKFGYGHHLQVALTKLEVENAMSFKTHWLVSLFKHDHPSFAERCERINEIEKKQQ